jgi:hypothetical protein
LLLATALVLLLATGLVACGGDDSSDPTTGSAPATTQESAPATTPEDDGSSQKEKEPGDDRGGSTGGSTSGSDDSGSEAPGSGSDDSGSDDSSSGSKSRDSSKVSPPKEEGSASFRTPGGDNSIQNYGEEADAEERAAASAVVAGFMRARASGDWAAVCGYMADATLKPLEQLASRSPQFKGKDCAAMLEILTGTAPDSTRASTLSGSVDSLRFKGDRGFALYHGTDGQDYYLPLVKEDGEWKVGALVPSAFS